MEIRKTFRIDETKKDELTQELRALRTSVLAHNEQDAIGELPKKTVELIQFGFNDVLQQIRMDVIVAFSPWFFTETPLDDELTPDLFIEDVARRVEAILGKYSDVKVISPVF